MVKVLLLILCFCSSGLAAIISNNRNCLSEEAYELKLSPLDFKWGQSLDEMELRYKIVYNSGKRLKFRAYVEDKKIILPVKNGQQIIVSAHFVDSIINHIETALSRLYANYIFFSDMGHAHLFVDKSVYEKKVKVISSENKKARYEIMLNDIKTKLLYHTAEQLKTLGPDKLPLKDKATQWRYFSRNIVGSQGQKNTLEVIYNPRGAYNSARAKTYDIGGQYKYWGAGVDISASKDGCFQFKHKGKTYNFDISLYAVQ